MTHICSNIKEYDGRYHCMECYKEFFTAEPKEDVMNMQMAAPAIERIQELEVENRNLKSMLQAMRDVIQSVKAPVEIQHQEEGDESKTT